MRQSNLAMAIMRVLSAPLTTVNSVSPLIRPVHLPRTTQNAGSSRQKKARSSFKQNRRLQMKSGNFKAKF
jgi:hypothetical protein